jgi:hypothetical protein
MKQLYSFSLLAVLFFSSCGRYPEGPGFSLRTPLQRILGSWQVESYRINGEENVTEFANYIDGFLIGFGSDEFSSDEFEGSLKGGIDSSNFFYCQMAWKFLNNETELQFDAQQLNNFVGLDGPFNDPDPILYTILRLTHDELWLEIDYKGKNYEIHSFRRK